MDINKLNPEQAQKIIGALKDGAINAAEAKKLGLTPQEAAALNEAFSSGQAVIGDYVLFNEGKTENGKYQRFQTKKDPMARFSNKELRYTLKSGRYVVYYRDAKTGKESFKYYAQDGTQLKTEYFMKQEKLQGKNPRIGENGKLSFLDKPDGKFTDEKGNFSLGNTLKSLAKIGFAVATGGLLVSCTPGGEDDIDIDMDQSVKVEVVNNNDSLEAALDKIIITLNSLKEDSEKQTIYLNSTMDTLKAILEREIENGATLDEIKSLIGGNTQLLEILVDAMTENNQLLAEIKDGMGENNNKVLEVLVGIQQTVDTLADMVGNLPDYSDQLNAILNGIKRGNVTLTGLTQMVRALLTEVAKNGDTQEAILKKLEEIEASSKSDSEKFAAMLELLKSIDTTTKDIDSKLDTVMGKLEDIYNNDKDVKASLEKILKAVQSNGQKQDAANAMLNTLLNMVNKLGNDAKADVKKILAAIAKNTDKIDSTNELLEKISAQDVALQKEILEYIAAVGFDMNANFSAILNAINKGAEGSDGIRALLEDVLAKMDVMDTNNKQGFNDVIEAIAGISTGSVPDLSKVEALLTELVDLSKNNGVKLDNITKQNDVIITILKSFKKSVEDALAGLSGDVKTYYTELGGKLDTIIAGLGKGTCKCNVDFDTLMQKLQEILEAIQNHKCECTCGNGTHEGIIGELDDILG